MCDAITAPLSDMSTVEGVEKDLLHMARFRAKLALIVCDDQAQVEQQRALLQRVDLIIEVRKCLAARPFSPPP